MTLQDTDHSSALYSEGWNEYKLIDSGGKEKLERFGMYIIRRPEPQALWNKSLPEDTWVSMSHASFARIKKNHENQADITGAWTHFKNMPREWEITAQINGTKIRMLLKLTSSGHIGIFPEQFPNWQFIENCLRDIKNQKDGTRVLNLFAYTGAASLISLAAGAEVFHLDSVRSVIDWTERNRELSGLPKHLHLIVEDAIKFLKREVRRGRSYHGLILDPPAYGRGPEGEKWVFDENIQELLYLSGKILEKGNGFLVLNWYSLGLSPYVMLNMMHEYFQATRIGFGEMLVKSETGHFLPLGTYLRFNTIE